MELVKKVAYVGTAALVAFAPTVASAESTLDRIKQRNKLIAGVKFDSPAIGLKDPVTGQLSGFDIEIAKIVANALGLTPDDIEFKEAVTANREVFITNRVVDIVISSNPITDRKREIVGMAGPYLAVGYQFLVKTEDRDKFKTTANIRDSTMCGAVGGAQIPIIEQNGGTSVAFQLLSECVQQVLYGNADAAVITTPIVAGYAMQHPGKLVVTGEPFAPLGWGIGLQKDDEEFCTFLRTTLQASINDGSWAKAYNETIGLADGVDEPTPPVIENHC